MQWLKISKKSDLKCELCGEKFSFRRVYAPNTPTHLSLIEFISGLVPIITSSIQKFLQILIVSICWIFLMPFGTMWWFNLCLKYLTTGRWSWKLFNLSYFDIILLWWDGVIISALIGLMSLCLIILLRPFIRVSLSILFYLFFVFFQNYFSYFIIFTSIFELNIGNSSILSTK